MATATRKVSRAPRTEKQVEALSEAQWLLGLAAHRDVCGSPAFARGRRTLTDHPDFAQAHRISLVLQEKAMDVVLEGGAEHVAAAMVGWAYLAGVFRRHLDADAYDALTTGWAAATGRED